MIRNHSSQYSAGLLDHCSGIHLVLGCMVLLLWPLNNHLPARVIAAEADQIDKQPHYFTLYWENDGTIPKKNNSTDRHYTNGLALSISHQPDWARNLAPCIPFHEQFEPKQTAAGYIIGQQMFTPENLESSQLIENDRPYVGYLFGGVYWQRANDLTMDHLQIDLGVVGQASGADEFQTFIHNIFDQTDPNGWDNQLDDEMTFQFYLRKKWRFDLGVIELFDTQIQNQLLCQCSTALGTVYRNVEGGLTFRLGYHLPDDFGASRLVDVASATGEPPQGWSGYLFGRLGGKVVEHNIFLEGNNFKGSHRVSEETFVGEVQAGMAVGYRKDNWHVNLAYSQTFMTKEFEEQDGSDAYGAIALSVTGWF